MKIYNDWYCDLEYGLKINYNASGVWEKEFNEDYLTATPINLNTTYYGSIQTDRSDADWYNIYSPGCWQLSVFIYARIYRAELQILEC